MPFIGSRKVSPLPEASPPPEFLRLDSPACTAIWEVPADAAPVWRYWGPRLADGVLPPGRLSEERPPTSWSLAAVPPLSLLPGTGTGWFGQSALLAHRSGRDWHFAVTACRVERRPDGALSFYCTDAVSRIELVVEAALDPATDTLTLATRLTNEGDAMLDVAWLAAATLPLPADATAVHSHAGRHNAEFQPVADPLTRSIWRHENRRGITGHDGIPGAVVTCADGTAYGAQLAWSGNHAQTIAPGEDGRYLWQLGEWLAPGEVRLAPGETLATPDVLATCAAEGTDGVAWAFHRAVRARLAWPGGAMKPRPVHLNTWEACYFAHDEADLKSLADAAAALGVERFVLDDGWFAGRRNDMSALGDWTADVQKYPDGLGPLAAHITSLGMAFGLWVEPEMVSPASDLYRRHPDWALQIDGRPLLTARNQLVLDLTRADVADHLFEALAALLSALPITYLKWDHNRDVTHAGAVPRYRQQVLAAYALLDRLRAAYPALEIEACAGGGGRIDAGIAGRIHRFWVSDNLDPLSRVAIQHGFLQYMPPELMGSHVGASPAHATGRMSAMALRCGVALPGAFGVELDPRRLDAGDRAVLAAAITRYKRLRGLLHGGRTWRGESADGLRWLVMGSAEDFVLLLIRTDPMTTRWSPPLRLPMCDPARIYVVAPEDEHGDARPIAGSWLASVGLAVPPMRPHDMRCWRVTAC